MADFEQLDGTEAPAKQAEAPRAPPLSASAERALSLLKLQHDTGMPLDVLGKARSLFEEFAEVPAQVAAGGPGGPAVDIIRDGRMSAEQFTRAVDELSGSHITEDLLQEVGFDGETADGGISFERFATWFWSHNFSEQVLLTEEQRLVREAGRKHGLNAADVDSYKRIFDRFDGNGNGVIEYLEFERILNTLMKIPLGLQLPESRARTLWREADKEGNGCINFEEFLLFYRRYFDDSSGCPFESFYSTVRRVPVAA